jgi:hypothetical protein
MADKPDHSRDSQYGPAISKIQAHEDVRRKQRQLQARLAMFPEVYSFIERQVVLDPVIFEHLGNSLLTAEAGVCSIPVNCAVDIVFP